MSACHWSTLHTRSSTIFYKYCWYYDTNRPGRMIEYYLCQLSWRPEMSGGISQCLLWSVKKTRHRLEGLLHYMESRCMQGQMRVIFPDITLCYNITKKGQLQISPHNSLISLRLDMPLMSMYLWQFIMKLFVVSTEHWWLEVINSAQPNDCSNEV